jgi:hypothetical protein
MKSFRRIDMSRPAWPASRDASRTFASLHYNPLTNLDVPESTASFGTSQMREASHETNYQI